MDQSWENGNENEFWLFSNVKMNVTNSWAKKVDKNGVICLVSMFHSTVMALTLSKTLQYFQFCADLSKKSKPVKVLYIYASERRRYALSLNGIAY